jgi:hypothetical protein
VPAPAARYPADAVITSLIRALSLATVGLIACGGDTAVNERNDQTATGGTSGALPKLPPMARRLAIVLVATLVLITYWPSLALWLPTLLYR